MKPMDVVRIMFNHQRAFGMYTWWFVSDGNGVHQWWDYWVLRRPVDEPWRLRSGKAQGLRV